MSGSVNKVILVGRLGADPEVNYTQQGAPIANLRIATSEQWNDRDSGEKKERTEWHRVSIFGSVDNPGMAAVAEKYLRKGSLCHLEGLLQTRKWTDRDGNERYTTEIVVKPFKGTLTLLDSKGSGGPPPAQGEDDYGSTSTRGGAPAGRPQAGDEDTIPFMMERRL